MFDPSTHVSYHFPDHLLIDKIFVRVPIWDWAQDISVKKQRRSLFARNSLWQTALVRTWPFAAEGKRWPGPIPQGLSRRRYAALYVSQHVVSCDGELDELAGHAYLYLKEQLERSTVLPSPGVLHGTIIDQFIACGKTRDRATDQLASQIWIAVINHLEENERTFILLKHLAQRENRISPWAGVPAVPYSRSYKVQWKVFEKLFVDFRDCFDRIDYFDVLARAKCKFQTIPSAWLATRFVHLFLSPPNPLLSVCMYKK
ncbi:unnamed protein product [Spirodela intermedia]|uniref:Uncharacterized protein n=1 Tax=Spirodela intermedia TaxID=51605 RepID=A0ABN7EAY7_SPIIN|nr:unnamed protein product [Spirodela intermedia]